MEETAGVSSRDVEVLRNGVLDMERRLNLEHEQKVCRARSPGSVSWLCFVCVWVLWEWSEARVSTGVLAVVLEIIGASVAMMVAF